MKQRNVALSSPLRAEQFGATVSSDGRQRLVPRPKCDPVEDGTQKEVGIDPANASFKDVAPLNPKESLLIRCQGDSRQKLKVMQYLTTVLQLAKCEFADHKGVYHDLLAIKKWRQPRFLSLKMRDPDRSVCKDHRFLMRGRFLGAAVALRSVPPIAANLLEASRRTSASSPILTREVFSRTPVSRDASPSSESSMFSVVRICINMPIEDAYVKTISRFDLSWRTEPTIPSCEQAAR